MNSIFRPFKYISVVVLICFCFQSNAQELDFTVQINTPKLQTADPKVFESLERYMIEFINNRDWIEDEFQSDEKIRGSIQLTITEEISENSFRGEIAIQANRPVYGTTYETSLLNHVDKDVQFSFEQYEPLIYTPNVFNDNLTSLLSFYVFVIIGMDYDTFSPYGGNPYYQAALEIVNNIPPSVAASAKGWRSLDGNRNRFWIIDNLLNPKIKTYRRAMYDYHRQGLDIMGNDVETGKATILTAISSLEEMNRSYPNSMILQMFSNTKAEEIIEIFKVASREQKSKITQVMTKLDASHASKYRTIGR
ncbi:MAG: DUF4835 family protein [Bacteroidia bacterium]|nr:DUF4835 family protein [Bacteroidia bacterium]